MNTPSFLDYPAILYTQISPANFDFFRNDVSFIEKSNAFFRSFLLIFIIIMIIMSLQDISEEEKVVAHEEVETVKHVNEKDEAEIESTVPIEDVVHEVDTTTQVDDKQEVFEVVEDKLVQFIRQVWDCTRDRRTV